MIKNQKFLITGGTGFIGSSLAKKILENGGDVTILSRKKINHQQIKYIQNIDKNFEYDVVINLCGEPISQRWTAKNKEKIYNSRVKKTNELVDIINNCNKPPKLLISGSAIGYYGTSSNLIFDENFAPTKQNLFSQKICEDWENAAKKINTKTRLVIIRTGVVVGKNGGIIKKMKLPFLLGLGGKVGDGKQILSWISLQDAIGSIKFIIENENISGPINLTAPRPTTNKDFSLTLAKTLNRPCFFDMPKFIAKILFGKMGEELLLAGQNVYPQKLLENNYKFQIVNIADAVKEALR